MERRAGRAGVASGPVMERPEASSTSPPLRAADESIAGAVYAAGGAFPALRGPTRASLAAVMLSLVAVASAILLGLFGRPIDQQGGDRGARLLHEFALWLVHDHDRAAAEPGYLGSRTVIGAWEGIGQLLGGVPVGCEQWRSALSLAGYDFLGASPAAVPTTWPVLHLVFGGPGDTGAAGLVSVVVMADIGQFGDAVRGAGVVAVLDGLRSRHGEADRTVYVLADGDFIYFATGCEGFDVDAAVRELLQPRVLNSR